MSLHRRSIFLLWLLALMLSLFVPSALAESGIKAESLDDSAAPKSAWTKLLKEFTDEDARPIEYAYGNGIYLTKSGGRTSQDGIQWVSNSNSNLNPSEVYDVVWGKGRFVAMGKSKDDSTMIWTSSNGVDWTESVKLRGHMSWPHIAFSGTRFVVAGGNNAEGYIYSSEDGLTWTERSTDIKTDLKDLKWGNNTFVALGYQGSQFFVSKNGITWNKVKIPVKSDVGMFTLEYGGGTFIATGDGNAIYSKDGVKWTSMDTKMIWYPAHWVKDRFFMSATKSRYEGPSLFYTSKDGVNWTVVKYPGKPNNFSVLDVFHDGKQFISNSGTAIFASVDGITWKQTQTINRKPPYLFRSAIGNGKMVTVGGGGSSSWGYVTISASGEIIHTMEDDPYRLHDVIWTGNQFFAVGSNGVMMTSKDGVTWKQVKSPTKESLSRIIRANGSYYITGSNGLIMKSTDLQAWTKQKTNTTSHLNAIAWSGKTFVAVGEWGTVLTSNNGTTWKSNAIKDAKGDAVYDMSDVAWGNGKFVITAAQRYNLYLPYTGFQSADGVKWTKTVLGESIGMTKSMQGVQFYKDTFVAVGDSGSIFLSNNGEAWTKKDFPENASFFSSEIWNDKLYVFGLDQIYVTEFNRSR